MKMAVLVALIVVISSFHVIDVIADTSPLPDNGCPKVRSIYRGVASFCNLNATLTCSENRNMALTLCIPIAIVIGAASIILIISILLLWCYCRHKKRSMLQEKSLRISLETDGEAEPLLITAPTNCPTHNSDHKKEMLDYSNSGTQSHEPTATPSTHSCEKRNRTREEELKEEREKVTKLAKKMFENKSVPLPDLGSRLQKYWYMMETKSVKEIQFAVKVSQKCRLKLEDPKTVDLIKELLKHLEHPCLLPVHDVGYKDGYVSILRPFVQKGSIRDYLFMVAPDQDWSDKYSASGGKKLFPKTEIARCGQHVLKAAEVLYSLGFQTIEQIHSGNVFILGDQYVLGGFENTLLGYKTSCYQALQKEELLDKIDVIMFGHLMYEMSRGYSVIHESILLTRLDYQNIVDFDFRQVTHFIFDISKKKNSCRGLMLEISVHKFFQRSEEDQESHTPVHLSIEVEQIITTVFSNELSLEVIVRDLDGKYIDERQLSQLGWRVGKVWADVKSTVLEANGLLTAVVVPDTCPIYVEGNIKIIKKLLLLNHDHVFSIRYIDYISIDGQQVMVIFQDKVEGGSLKDIIYQCPCTTGWHGKYKQKGQKMKVNDIKRFGAQILEAMSYLSHLLGKDESLSLGYVHTGNIFLDGGICKLGGFENALLGYRTRKYTLFEDCLANLDVLMFGHVMFEMSTGRELETTRPTEKDYKDVPKDLHPVLRYIFGEDSPDIDKTMTYFQVAPAAPVKVQVLELDSDTKFLLEKVRKGKARKQDDQTGKIKQVFQVNFRKLKQLIPV